MVKLTTYDRNGGKTGQPLQISKLNNGKNVPFGLDILRTTTTYGNYRRFEVDVQEDVHPGAGAVAPVLP